MTPAPTDFGDIEDVSREHAAPAPPAGTPPPAGATAPAPAPAGLGSDIEDVSREHEPPAGAGVVPMESMSHKYGITSPWIGRPLDFAEEAGAGAVHTLHGLNKLLPFVPQVIPDVQVTDSMAGGWGKTAEQAAEWMLPAGKLGEIEKGAATYAAKSPLFPKLAEAGTRAVIQGGAGAILGGAQADDTKSGALWGGVPAAAIAAVAPPLAKMVQSYLGAKSGVGPEVIQRAITSSPDLQAAMNGKITQKQTLDAARAALAKAFQARSNEYTASLNQLVQQNPQALPQAISSTKTELIGALHEFGIGMRVSPSGQLILDFQGAGIPRGSENAIQNIAEDVWGWGRNQKQITMEGLNDLKKRLSGDYLASASGQIPNTAMRRVVNGFSARMSGFINNEVATRIPGYSAMNEAYAKASNELQQFTRSLSLNNKNDTTAMSKLISALHQRNNLRSELVEALNRFAPPGTSLSDQIAGHALNSLWPRGIAGPLTAVDAFKKLLVPAGMGAAGTYAGHPLAGALGSVADILASSPYILGKTLPYAGRAAPLFPAMGGYTGSRLLDMQQQQNSSGFARGGRVRYDDGGGVDSDTPAYDPNLFRGMPRVVDPTSLWPSRIQLDPERSKQNLFQSYGKAKPFVQQQPPAAKPPALPLPWEQEVQKPTGATGIPEQILDQATAGAGQFAQGVEGLASSLPSTAGGWMHFAYNPAASGVSPRAVAGNVHQMAGGAMGMATPAMLGAAATAPFATAASVGAGMYGQQKVEEGLQALGLPQEYAGVAGDLAGLIVGAAGHGVMGRGSEELGALRARVAPELEARWQAQTRAANEPTQWLPSRERLDAAAQAARQRLMESGAYSGATAPMGIDPAKLKDIGILTGAQLGSGLHAVGEAATARANQIKDYLRGQREQYMLPSELEALEKARQQYPEIHDVADYLMPLEAQKMLASPQQTEAMARLLRVLPHADKMAALAQAGAPKLGWYRGSAQALSDVFGADAPRFAQLLAATSPRISVEGNLINALNIWKNWTAEGRPTEPENILRIMAKSVQGDGTEKSVMEAWRNNTYAALGAQDPMALTLSGPKVDSFQHNLRDHVMQVTNDAWMANAFGVAQNLFQGQGANPARGNPGMTTEYGGTSARLRQGAAQAGMLPSQGQEAIWSVAMQLYELGRQHNMDPRDVLQKGLLTPDKIRGTPDFSTLLRHPEYLKVLDEAGYGDAARKMKPYAFQVNQANLTPAQQQLLMESAGTIGDVMSLRDRESRSGQIALPKGWTGKIPKATTTSEKSLATRQRMIQELYPQTATGITNLEMIPGAVTGHLPEVAKLEPSGRVHYTSTMYGPQTNLQGSDIIQTAGLGPTTMPSRNVQGAYLNAKGRLETQKGRAAPFETGLDWKPAAGTPQEPVPFVGPWRPDIDPQMRANLRGSMALQAFVNAQEGVGNNILVPSPSPGWTAPRPEGQPWVEPSMDVRTAIPPDSQHWVAPEPTMQNAIFPLEKEVSEERIGALQKKYPNYVFASAGPNMHVLGLGNLIKHTEALNIQKMLKGKSFIPAENIGEYMSMADQWNHRPGANQVMQELFDNVNQMSPEAYAEEDRQLRQVAGDAYEKARNYYNKKGWQVRHDFMNALGIAASGGLKGLERAYNSKAFLPGVAAAVLLPRLLSNTQKLED